MDVQLGLHVVQECAQQFGARLALLVGQAVEQPARELLKGEGASASHGAAVGPRESGPTAREWAGLGVVLLAMFMSQIDMFIVSVAVPEIQSDLHAGFGQMQFVIDGYVIAYAAGMVTGGRLGDRVGRKKVFQWGVAAFTVTSLLCALAPSANTLVAARVLQGLSAALMAPQVLSILRAVFVHDRDRSRAVGAYGASNGSGVIAGLVGGGLLLDLDVAGLGWRMIFLLRLPPARRQVRHPRIDRRSHHHGRESVRRADGDRHGDGPQALYLAGIMGISGFGQGLVVAPLIDTVLARVHPDDAGAGSGVLNTVTQAGMALGVAAIGALYRAFLGASPQEPEHPVRAADFADAFDATSCVLAALALVAALLCGLLGRARVTDDRAVVPSRD